MLCLNSGLLAQSKTSNQIITPKTPLVELILHKADAQIPNKTFEQLFEMHRKGTLSIQVSNKRAIQVRIQDKNGGGLLIIELEDLA